MPKCPNAIPQRACYHRATAYSEALQALHDVPARDHIHYVKAVFSQQAMMAQWLRLRTLSPWVTSPDADDENKELPDHRLAGSTPSELNRALILAET